MPGKIDFRYDPANDLVVATPRWKLLEPDDVLEWFRQYEVYMKRFRRKMDMIFVLDHFEFRPAMGVLWGEYRAKVHQLYVGIGYAVNATNAMRVFANTSGVRYNVFTYEAATVEDAIEGIKESRRLLAKGG